MLACLPRHCLCNDTGCRTVGRTETVTFAYCALLRWSIIKRMLKPITLRCEPHLQRVLDDVSEHQLALAVLDGVTRYREDKALSPPSPSAQLVSVRIKLDHLPPFERNAWTTASQAVKEGILNGALARLESKEASRHPAGAQLTTAVHVECEVALQHLVAAHPPEYLGAAVARAISDNRAGPLPGVPAENVSASRRRVEVPPLPLDQDNRDWWEVNKLQRGRVLKRALELLKAHPAGFGREAKNTPVQPDQQTDDPAPFSSGPFNGGQELKVQLVDQLQVRIAKLREYDLKICKQETTIRDNEQNIAALEEELRELQESLKGIERTPPASVTRTTPTQRERTQASEASALLDGHRSLQDLGREVSLSEFLAVHLGLLHAPFTVLTGPPGTGKTSILQLYGQAMGMAVHLIPMSPAWVHQDDLMGYMSPVGLQPEFISGPLGKVMLDHARAHRDPYLCAPCDEVQATLVILDEINLVVVEHVLAGLLSALALDRPEERRLMLARASEAARLPDGQLSSLLPVLPVGVGIALSGTANEDHTTEGFSDRFRDRSAMLSLMPPDLETLLSTQLKRGRGPAAKKTERANRFLDTATRASWQTTEPQLEEGPSGQLTNTLITLAKNIHAPGIGLPAGARSVSRAAHISRRALALLADLELLRGSGKSRKNLENDLIPLACDIGIGVTLAQRASAITALQPDPEDARERLSEALRKGTALPEKGICLRHVPRPA